MEDLLAIVISALIGSTGFFLGQRFTKTNKTLAETAKWYETELGHMRTEVNRYRQKANFYQRGNVPQDLANVGEMGDVSALVDGIISALPPNFRKLAQNWKAPLIEYMKANPEAVAGVIEKIKGMAGGRKEDAPEMQLL